MSLSGALAAAFRGPTFVDRLERSRLAGWLWVLGCWALLIGPTLALRGTHYEEGTVIALARGAAEGGYWLVPHEYGFRFVERPVLLSWIIGALGSLAGSIGPVVARLPTVLSLLAGAGMVFWLVRRHANTAAAVFAAVCALVSPMMLQKLITAEPDMLLSALLFAAFLLWWNGIASERATAYRWVATGLVLGLAGLVKGPQPIAYFVLGAGAFLLVRRRWSDLAGAALASAIGLAIVGAWYAAVYQPGDVALWMKHSRMPDRDFAIGRYLWGVGNFVVSLALECLPAVLLLGPALWRLRRMEAGEKRELLLALILYAGCCTLVLAIWPGGRTRYAMPGLWALAAIAGLVLGEVKAARPLLVRTAATIATILFCYQATITWLAMPMLSDLFESAKRVGTTLTALRAATPGTLFVHAGQFDHNAVVYVRMPIRAVSVPEMAQAPAGWALVSAADLETAAQFAWCRRDRHPGGFRRIRFGHAPRCAQLCGGTDPCGGRQPGIQCRPRAEFWRN